MVSFRQPIGATGTVCFSKEIEKKISHELQTHDNNFHNFSLLPKGKTKEKGESHMIMNIVLHHFIVWVIREK